MYTAAWSEFDDYVERNGHEPEPVEYDRLSKAVDDAAAVARRRDRKALTEVAAATA